MPLNRKKVLIISDDAVSLYMIREVLADEHLEVTTLRQGSGALDLVKSIRPDLILIDNMMSSSSGEAIRNILGQDEETRTIPLVPCSSTEWDSLRERVQWHVTSSKDTGKGMHEVPKTR